MNHEELLEAVKDIPTTRVVVELHKPTHHPCGRWDCNDKLCNFCQYLGIFYPCPTIQAIEKELL